MRQTINISIQTIPQFQADFAKGRNWKEFPFLRNLTLALKGEVGELAEVYQWEGAIDRGFSADSLLKI